MNKLLLSMTMTTVMFAGFADSYAGTTILPVKPIVPTPIVTRPVPVIPTPPKPPVVVIPKSLCNAGMGEVKLNTTTSWCVSPPQTYRYIARCPGFVAADASAVYVTAYLTNQSGVINTVTGYDTMYQTVILDLQSGKPLYKSINDMMCHAGPAGTGAPWAPGQPTR